MTRKEFVDYLEEKCCIPSQFDENPADDSGCIFVNTLNGIECFVPNDDIIDDLTVLKILTRFKVTIPDHLDDFYNGVAVFIEEELRGL